MLNTLEETKQRILKGEKLLLAGDENMLRQLPRGQWIGGTIPYFMTNDGGISTPDRIFVNTIPTEVNGMRIISYNTHELERMTLDAYDNGFSVIIIPATSSSHIAYAQNAPNYTDMFMKPTVGWIAGVHLSQLGDESPKIFDGETGESSNENAVVMHLSLPSDKAAFIKICNLFEPGNGDEITFETEGFKVKDCLVNGEKKNFGRYLLEKRIDTRCPMMADYCGTLVNVSFQSIDEDSQEVSLYAPVFQHVTYRIASEVPDYVSSFQKNFPRQVKKPAFACNCILNYLYSELEGKKTGDIAGPVTFGEIAYQLLNQTLVYVEIENV